MLSFRGALAWRGALVFVAAAVAACALSLYVSGPGWMAIDSSNQLAQARSFQFRDDHPVLMALIWRYTDRVLPGPFGMLLLTTSSYWAGLAALFWSLPGPLGARVAALVLVGFFPPVFSNVPVVWKDTLMQAALVASIGCFALDGRGVRRVASVLGLGFAVVGLGVRHNAMAAVWPLLALPLLRSGWLASKARWVRLAAALGVALVLTLALSAGLRRALAPLAVATEFWQFLPAFDLAGMSIEVGENLVEPDTGLLTPGMGLEEIRRFYDPEYMNPLYYCIAFEGKRCVPVFNKTRDREKLERLGQNWRQAIVEHPLAYVKHRWRVSAALLALRGAGARGIYFVDRARPTRLAREYPPPPRTLALLGWIEGQVRKLWFRPWLYFLIAVALIPVTLVDHLRGTSPAPLLYALSGVAYMGSLFVGTGSSDYRYTVWTTLSALLALLVAGAPALDSIWQRGRARSPGAQPAAEAWPKTSS